MKKKVTLFVVFVFLCSINKVVIFATDFSHIDTLKKCGIVKGKTDSELSLCMTRRECLEYIIKVSGDLYGEASECSFENYGIRGFSDVKDGTSDCQLVITSYINGILKGRVNENGEITAKLDSCITWYEALIMLDRLFLSNIYSDELLKGDTGWYDFAVQVGIIKTSDLIFDLDIDQKNELVCQNDFLYVLNSALHTPMYTRTYEGVKVEYLIDNFLE